MTPDANAGLAAALGRIPSGLFIVTYFTGPAESAMLASWVQQCSFDPPALTMAVKQGRGISEWLTDGAPFAVARHRPDSRPVHSGVESAHSSGEAPSDRGLHPTPRVRFVPSLDFRPTPRSFGAVHVRALCS